MGRFDDLTADLQPSAPGTQLSGGGRFDDLINDLSPIKQKPGEGLSALEFERSPNYPNARMTDPTASDAMTVYGLGSLAKTGVGMAADTTLGKAVLNSPSSLSPEYDVLHEAAGISKNLPETGGRVARFPNMAGLPSSSPPPFAPAIAPKLYPQNTNALLNFARSRMEGLGDQLSPQELQDYRTLIGQMIDTGKVGSGKPFAMASQLKSQATDLLNNRVEGLADLNKVYALSTKLRNPTQFLPEFIQNGIQKYGPWFGRAAAVKLGLDVFH